jgi:hypothetical protein
MTSSKKLEKYNKIVVNSGCFHDRFETIVIILRFETIVIVIIIIQIQLLISKTVDNVCVS